eukprot:9195107-Pyramimonas_sp.AAC.1
MRVEPTLCGGHCTAHACVRPLDADWPAEWMQSEPFASCAPIFTNPRASGVGEKFPDGKFHDPADCRRTPFRCEGAP